MGGVIVASLSRGVSYSGSAKMLCGLERGGRLSRSAGSVLPLAPRWLISLPQFQTVSQLPALPCYCRFGFLGVRLPLRCRRTPSLAALPLIRHCTLPSLQRPERNWNRPSYLDLILGAGLAFGARGPWRTLSSGRQAGIAPRFALDFPRTVEPRLFNLDQSIPLIGRTRTQR